MKTIQKSLLGTCAVGLSVLAASNLPGMARPGEQGDRPSGPPPQDSRGPGYGRGPRDGRPPRHDGPPIEMMTRELGLTPEQQKKITAITDKMHEEMQRLHEKTRTQIDAVLTPAQRAKMQAFREQHGPPPGGPDDRRPPRGDHHPQDSDNDYPPADDR